MEVSAGAPEIIRLFPTFVWKNRIENGARAKIRRAVLDTLAVLRSGLPDPAPGEVWQSRHGLREEKQLEPLLAHIHRGVTSTGRIRSWVIWAWES